MGSEADYYDDYGIDYSAYDDQLGAVGDFLSDLNPEFLATVSADLIVSYIEGASPAEVENILNNSTLLRNLPPETIGELLRKLPDETILQVVNSKGVLDLFNKTTETSPGIIEIQKMLAPVIIKNLDADILASLPLPLIKSHLNIEPALLELFRESDKLETLIKRQPGILQEISFDFIAQILMEHPDVERMISDGVIMALLEASPTIIDKFPISFLKNIARDRPWLVAKFPTETIGSLATRHEVLFDLGDKELMELLNYRPSILNILIDLPADVLLRFLRARTNLLDILPEVAEEYLQKLIQDETFLRKMSPELLADMARHQTVRQFLDKRVLVTILRAHPALPAIIPAPDIAQFLPLLADPWFRIRLPCATISALSESLDFIKVIPAEILEIIVTSKRMLSCVPVKNLEMLLSHEIGLSRVSIFSLLTSFSRLPSEKLSLKLIRLILMEQVILNTIDNMVCVEVPFEVDINFRTRLPVRSIQMKPL